MKESMAVLIEKSKKSSKLNIEDKEIYEKDLALELSMGEFTNDIETMLCEGPIDSSMKVFVKFLVKNDTEIAIEFIKKFIDSNKIIENNGGASGMRIVPLYLLLSKEYKKQNKVVETVFLAMVHYAYTNQKNQANQTNQTNKMNKKVVELIRMNVLPTFSDDSNILNLSFVNNDSTWIKIRNLFIEVITEVKAPNYNINQKVFYWLKATGKKMGIFSEEFIMNKLLTNSPGENHMTDNIKSTQTTNKANSDTQVKAVKENQTDKDSVQETLVLLASVLLNERREIANIKTELGKTNRKVSELQVLLDQVQLKEKQNTEIIKVFAEEKSVLQNTNLEYVEKISKLEKFVEKQHKEIEDRKKFTDTVTRNRERQSEEHLNKLASKLKIDYSDYCDAKDLEMNVDLGENMREQLGTIFSILEKNGIKLK